MSQLTRLKRNASTDDVIAVLERDGGVIIEGFLHPTLLSGLQNGL